MAVVEEAFPLGAIPERLKCSLCTALARGAWKLPCCDQIICGSCYESLPEDVCPICAFTPLEKEKCIVSTSLRTTIAVFLRHAEKRHNDALAKEAKAKSVNEQILSGREVPQSRVATIASTDDSQEKFHNTADHSFDRNSYALHSGQTSMQGNVSNASFQPINTGIQHQQFSYDGMYGAGLAGMSMGFPMVNDLAMVAMNPLMLQPQMSEGAGGYGSGLDWNAQMEYNYTPQNMYMQTQDHDSNHISHGVPSSEQASGGYRGRYAPRGNASFRGGRGAHSSISHPVAPVVVEGAPTGPSAMRNGTDSRGRNYRGRGGSSHISVPSHHESRINAPDEDSRNNLVPSTSRGRSKTRSVTRERSSSPRRRRHQSRSRERRPRPLRSKSRSHSRSHDRNRRERTKRSNKDHAISSRDRETSKSEHHDVTEKSLNIKGCSLADRIERRSPPRSRSGSPIRKGSKSHSSAHRHRRHRSRNQSRSGKTRSRSGSREGRRRSNRHVSSERDREDSKKYKRNSNDFEDNTNEKKTDGKSSRRHRSRDRGDRKSSRRSNAKYEISASELRRLESEREHPRYD